MLKQTFKPMRNRDRLPSFAGRYLPRPFGLDDDVPILATTLLGLELLLQEPLIDLGLASELVLSDVGASLQILRIIGSEYPSPEDRPSRMEDCLASVDLRSWFGAVSSTACSADEASITALWRHSRLIAQCAKRASEHFEGVCPREAYLVGLLHEIRRIPALMGWPMRQTQANQAAIHLAIEWSLPSYILAPVRSLSNFGAPSIWKAILRAAHEQAGAADLNPPGPATSSRALHCLTVSSFKPSPLWSDRP